MLINKIRSVLNKTPFPKQTLLKTKIEDIAHELEVRGYNEFKLIGSGRWALVFDIGGDNVLRIGLDGYFRLPIDPHINPLIDLWGMEFGYDNDQLSFQIFPKVTPYDEYNKTLKTVEERDSLYIRYHKVTSYLEIVHNATDIHTGNIGITKDGTLVSIDPGMFAPKKSICTKCGDICSSYGFRRQEDTLCDLCLLNYNTKRELELAGIKFDN